MDSTNSHQRLLAVGDYLFMRRSCLQLVTTFSLFSLLISVSWVTSGTIAKSYVYIKFNPFFSSFFTHTLERKYMFLVFYGILAFLATSSSSASSTSTTNSNGTRSNISSESSASYAHHHEEEEELVVEGSAAVDDCDEIDDDSDVEECDQDAHNQVASEEKVKVQDGDCNSQIQHQGVEVEEVEEEEEEEEEEGSELEGEGGNGEDNGCSTEEMNSRFDELIRKMKVRMMSESKQQKLLQQLIDSVQLL